MENFRRLLSYNWAYHVKKANMQIQENKIQANDIIEAFLKDGKIIDLDSLRELSGNDLDFIAEILGMFTATANEQVQEMKELLKAGNMAGLSSVAHKFKSSVSILGNSRLYELVNELEYRAKNNGNHHEISENLELLSTIVERVYVEIANTALAA